MASIDKLTESVFVLLAFSFYYLKVNLWSKDGKYICIVSFLWYVTTYCFRFWILLYCDS